MNKLLYLLLVLSLTNACSKKALSELAAAEDQNSGSGGGSSGGGGGSGGSSGGFSGIGTSYSIIPSVNNSAEIDGYKLYKKSEFSSTSHGELIADFGAGPVTPFKKFLPGNTNTTMFFTVYDTTYGAELWKSDGTSSGTVIVKDIVAGTGSARFYANCALNDNQMRLDDQYESRTAYLNTGVFFTLTTCSGNYNGEENLWVSDGTSSGTKSVKELLNLVDGPDANNNNNVTHYSVELIKQLNNEYVLVSINKRDETTAGYASANSISSDGYKLAIVGVSGLYKEIDIPLDNGNPDRTFFISFNPDQFTFVNVDGNDVFIRKSGGFFTFRLTDTTPTLLRDANSNWITSNAYTWGQYSRMNQKMFYHDASGTPVWKIWDATSRSFVNNTNIPNSPGLIHPNGTGFLYVKDSDKTMYRCNQDFTTCTQLQYNSAPAIGKSDKQVVVAAGTFVVLDLGSNTCDIAVLKNDGTWNDLSNLKTFLTTNQIPTSYCSVSNSQISMGNISFHGPNTVFYGIIDQATFELEFIYLDANYDVVQSVHVDGVDMQTRFLTDFYSELIKLMQNGRVINAMSDLDIPLID